MRLGIAQLTSTDQVQANLAQIEKLLAAADSTADVLVFPENSLFFRIRSGTAPVGLDLHGPELAQLQNAVEQGSTAVLLTTPLSGEGRLKNATILLAPGQSPRVLYRKIHLFDVDVLGAPPVRESDTFASGEDEALWTWKDWTFGLSICYDIRFAELYSRYAPKADVILVPSAFLQPTGEAHWHVLLRARAIENQCYVVAPAQSGEHRSGDQVRRTFGHSLVVDPWGKVILDLETASPSLRYFDLDRQLIAKVRQQIPMAQHRRL